ncbi:WD40-repeat-containing domain [Pseudocohnilembus persalinus]|uniref:WD40-repeat-containing domain n=1 Tax=Pseudocohnilembus persalinus TaxID=266149 RepID=A0A0V0Q8X3_PSEPJ|nr:WD40-repeat-containing domain [Pseudocohnilembus persalinus]|eukprot:KRW98471.1 WD40-repeat-containing domain [Pseudocohnilembus persalinus]
MQSVQEEIKYYLVQKNGDVIYGENNSGFSNHILSSKILFEQYDIIVFEIDIMDLSFQFYNIINPNYKSPVVKLFQSEQQSHQQNNKLLNFNIYPCCILEPNESVGFENGPVLGKYFQGILSQIQNQKLQQTQFDKKESVYQNQVDQTIQYTEEENIYIIEGLKNQVFNEYCLHDQQFSAFLDFLKEDILQENYTRQYLQNYIEQNITFSQNENYNGIIDPVQESVIQKIIQQKIQINNPLELVFQLKSYIPGTKCTRNEKDNEKLDLMTEVDRFLTDFRTKSQQQNQKQIFILVGDSGTGKTSFINQIQHHYEFLTNNQHNLIQVHKLRFGQYHSQKQLEQDVEQIYINYQKKINNQVHINQYYGSSLGQQNQQPTIRQDSQSNFLQQNYQNMQKFYTPNYQLQNIHQTNYENLSQNQRQGQVNIKIQNEMANSQQQQFNYKYINETVNQSDNSSKIENKLQNGFEYNQSHSFKQGQNNQNLQNLGYHSFQMSQNNYISQINQQNNSNSQYIQKTSQIKIIFLLDGYDEISFKQDSNTSKSLKFYKKYFYQFFQYFLNKDSQNTNIGDEKAHSTTSSSSYKLNLVEIFKLDQFINVKLIITSRKETIPENSLSQIFTFDSQDPKENQMLVRKKCSFYYISLFQPSQIVQFIDKYIESVNDSALNLYTNKVSFSKEQYLQYFKKNKELEQMASNPLMLRIILEVLPKIQQVLNYQFQLNKSQDWLYINKKAFSRYNLYKEFIKNWISVKVQVKLDNQQIQKIAQQQQSQAFLDQELQFIKKNSQIQRFEDKKEPINIQKAKFRIFVFNRILAMGLFVQTTQTFTKQNVLQIFKNQKCGFINIGGDIESYLQCSPVKKNGENYEYIHKSVFEYYVADNILTEIQLITKEIIKPEIPQIKIQVEKVINIFYYLNKSTIQFLIQKMGGKQYLKRNNVSQLKNWFPNQNYMNNDSEQKLSQLNNLDVINMKLNQVRLNRSHLTIIRFIQNYYFQYDNYENLKQLQKVLQKLIQYSRPKENKKKNLYLSSNAATIYNALNFSFSGLDLSNTELEGAILQSAIMHKTNMQNANLKHAQLSASILQESNIIGANIQNADFGKMPDLKKQEKPIQCVIYSPNGKYIASGDDDSNVTLYLLNNPDQFYRREKVHKKGVNSISFSPNSKYLVSGSSDKSIVIWDTSLQVLVQKNNAHKDSITCVKFSQNKFNKSLIIATASEDSYIIIWKFIQYKQDYAFSNQESFNYDLVPEHYLKEHQSCVTSIAFFDDGKKLISGSEDEQGIILIWEETKVAWVVRQKLKTGLSLVDQIAISPDNNFIIASSSEEIQIWKQISYFQMNHMKDWIKYQSLDSGATCVAFSNDGKYVATGNRVIKLWNVESGELLQIMEGNSVVKDLIFSPFSSQLENNYIIAGHYDNTIKIYNISITQQLQLRDGHREEVVSLVISQDEKLIASGGVGGHIKIWNLESGELVTQMNGFHTMGVNQMEFCEDIYGNTILISVGGKVIYIWETQTGRKVATYFGHEEDIICVSYNSIYRQIATGSLDKTIKVWPIPDYFNNLSPQSLNFEKYGSNQIQDNLNLPNYEPDPLITYQVPNCVNAVKYSQTCQFLAAGLDNIVSVYLVHKNYQNSAQKQIYEPIMVFNQNTINPTDLHVGTILSVAFLPDERIVSAGQDKKINVWCIDNQGYIDCQIDANMGDINKISYLPVYQPFSYEQSQKKKEKPIYIVAGGTNQLIKIWDINQKRIGGNISKFMISVPALIIRGHQGPIYCMSVSPSGKYIASGSKSLKIWKRKYKYVQVNNNFNLQKNALQKNVKNIDQAQNMQKKKEQSDYSDSQENKQLLQEQLQINQQHNNLVQQSQQQQQQQQFQVIEYLLQRNISKSQAFQCYGLKYSNCEIKGSGPILNKKGEDNKIMQNRLRQDNQNYNQQQPQLPQKGEKQNQEDGRATFKIGRTFEVLEKIDEGAFGQVFKGRNIKTGMDVAIKLEPTKSKHPQLFFECKLYQYLLHDREVIEKGIPNVYLCMTEGDYNIMVMDLLGPSLESLFQLCERKFSVKTVLMLADQLIQRIEYIHSRYFMHRDIKPDNFLMGLGRNSHKVYCVDLGLAKRYRKKDGKHIEFKEGKNLTGTARYASIKTHTGIEQSRRDDLESLGYVFFYFLRGILPWQNLQAKDKKEKYQKIMQKKMSTTVQELGKGFPEEFSNYLIYCQNLAFEETPDYDSQRKMFKELFKKSGYEHDYVYDWSLISKDNKSKNVQK